jgi:hypothetical protein
MLSYLSVGGLLDRPAPTCLSLFLIDRQAKRGILCKIHLLGDCREVDERLHGAVGISILMVL